MLHFEIYSPQGGYRLIMNRALVAIGMMVLSRSLVHINIIFQDSQQPETADVVKENPLIQNSDKPFESSKET